MTAPNRRRRRPFVTALSLVMVLGITTGWSHPTTAGHRLAALSGGASTALLRGSADLHTAAARSLAATRLAALAAISERSQAVVVAGLVGDAHVRELARQEAAKAAAKAAAERAAKVAQQTTKTTASATYTGRNHFWIPSLGMSYPVYSYACGRTTYPANHIYRWGCGGRNNVYLFGHAGGVMKPLHDLYVRGGLRKGMIAVFADSSGHVRKYRVTAWQVVYPTEVAWAIASQPVPSMTLQTCVGVNSTKRLDVRLVAVN